MTGVALLQAQMVEYGMHAVNALVFFHKAEGITGTNITVTCDTVDSGRAGIGNQFCN
jgi:hypothetical protein